MQQVAPPARVRVFVDTNVTLEAFRIGCWPALAAAFSVETVEKCVEEALTGDPADPRHVTVDRDVLVAGLAARHAVDKRTIARFALAHPASAGLDDGELHLLAWLHGQGQTATVKLLLSTADKAAIVAAGRLDWLDIVTSLEQLAQQAGVSRVQVDQMARHYRQQWLDEIKVKVRLGIIP